eukprot:TRINITY_DN3846_c0_g4_i1.p1 TRINITY_DN3846_c0_g4~~TRINITY_DN3846_c0_g4_i1.p1  ORF type:complete len:1422 (-),score=137.95 TRINITY_DN3846_c0_g4_i1:223-4488(-)
MSNMKKSKERQQEHGQKLKPPTFWQNPYAFITFQWFTPLLNTGYRRQIQQEDLFDVVDEVKTKVTYPKFLKVFQDNVENLQTTQKGESILQSIRDGHRAALLMSTIWKNLKRTIMLQLILYVFYNGMQFTGPLFLKEIVEFLQQQQLLRNNPDLREELAGNEIPVGRAYAFAAAMFVAPLIGSICMTHSNRFGIYHQLAVRAQLTAAVFRKAMKMSNQARQQTETGKIVNLMSTDVQNVVNFFYPFLSILFSGPITIIVALVLLYFQIEWATFIGLGIMLFSGPSAAFLVKNVVQLRKKMLTMTDKRVKLMNQLLQGIRVLKMYAWEDALQDKVLDSRTDELRYLWGIIPYRVGLQTIVFATPLLASVASFAVYGSVKPQELTPAKVFASIALFAMLRFPLAFLQFAVVQFGNAWVSLRRISQFLVQEEYQDYAETLDSPGIIIENGCFTWVPPQKKAKDDLYETESEEDAKKVLTVSAEDTPAENKSDKQQFQLQDINIDITPGEFVCVVGRVGCGKSSLLNAILGEMIKLQGRIARGGSIAYVAQTAWIVNDTLKGNITMSLGQPKDEVDDAEKDIQLQEVVKACCLEADIDILPGGMMTEIGEKGINLSGGQKQRVSIARAVYQNRDVYLLDDPLSAVDVHVGQHIFQQCITGVLKDKTRVLVTNQPYYLPKADKVLYVENGRIALQGTYEECLAHPGFRDLLQEFCSDYQEVDAENQKIGTSKTGTEANPEQVAEMVKVYEKRISIDAQKEAMPKQLQEGPSLQKQFTMVQPAGNQQQEQQCAQDEKSRNSLLSRVLTSKLFANKPSIPSRSPSGHPMRLNKGALTAAEGREQGQVQVSIYVKYAKMYGYIALLFVILFWSIEQSLRVLTNWWLSRWTEEEASAQVQGESTGEMYYIWGYLGFALGFVVAVLFKATGNLTSAWRAAWGIHKVALAGIVRSPMSFFDTTPIGRALNRFSRDTDDLDFSLPQSISELGNCIFQLLATAIFISVVQPWFIVAIVPLGVIYYFMQRYYRRSSIELQRLDAVTRSPVYAHFSETLNGLDTLRAYHFTDMFQNISGARVDDNNRAYASMKSADEWLGFRLDFIGSAIIFSTAILAVVNRNNLDAALAALALSEALDVTAFLKHAVKAAAMAESRFNAVERLLEYAELESEAPAIVKDNRPVDQWPSQGVVVYKSISMRYREGLDSVLKSVSFEVDSSQSIGIVGRTGSGKSSLIVVLFRMVEPFEGCITIDGMNILKMGLHDLRSRVAAIPQDPVLFTGTLRYNLDPTNFYTDKDIWNALELVGMKQEIIDKAEGGLDISVSESGTNFSLGQRQLLCVARALLRKPKVLAADEATASVDSETDAKIQRTIRQNFKDCTVLTIAHRLNTIMDSDKVLVMESGHVKEYDSVQNLLKLPNGLFREMVESSAKSRNK